MPELLVPTPAKPKVEPEILRPSDQVRARWLLALLSILAFYIYLDSLTMIAGSWRNPQNSHGFLVPMFALFLMGWKREPFRQTSSLERWSGVGLIAFALIVRIVSAYYTTFTPDNMSLIPCLAGIFVLVGGWRALKWAAMPLAFLVFMYPWPNFAERLILVQLKQHIAMPISLFVLQTLGVECYLVGNVIELGDGTKMNVVDACAGLAMLNLFLALAAGLAIISQRPVWERIAVFLCALPIALIVNPLRITTEGLIFYYGPSILSEASAIWWAGFFHNWIAPWFMMILALGMLFLAHEFLKRLFVEDTQTPVLKQSGPKLQPSGRQ